MRLGTSPSPRPGPHGPAAGDPQQRLRAAGRPQSGRRHGPGPPARLPVTRSRPYRRRPASRARSGRSRGPSQCRATWLVCGAERRQPASTTARARPTRLPTQIPGNVATAPFECIAAKLGHPGDPARISLYGHGLLGSHTEVDGGQRRGDGHRAQHGLLRHRLVGPGLGRTRQRCRRGAEPEPVPERDRPAPAGRAEHALPGPAAAQPRRVCRQPRLPVRSASADRHLAPVLRRQQPGRDRGRHAHRGGARLPPRALGVTGMDYGNVLVQRSTDFAPFGAILYAAYPRPLAAPVDPRSDPAALGPRAIPTATPSR